MKHQPTPEARALARAKRAANIASTRPTTRPGSEYTDLKVGDEVFVYIPDARTAVSRAYHGRKGWVAVINAQTFDSGVTYVEIGVSWSLVADLARMSADTWFRADEVRAVS
jgi:hypothetical protein